MIINKLKTSAVLSISRNLALPPFCPLLESLPSFWNFPSCRKIALLAWGGQKGGRTTAQVWYGSLFESFCTRLQQFVAEEAQKRELRQLYRSQQIHHQFACDIMEYNLPVTLCIAEFLLITSIYTIVRQFHSNHPSVLIGIGSVGVATCLYLRTVLEMAGSLVKASEEYMELKSKDSALPHAHFSILDRQFFRSCRPLKVKVADTFSITRDTFIRIMDQIVVNSVINLLVAF